MTSAVNCRPLNGCCLLRAKPRPSSAGPPLLPDPRQPTNVATEPPILQCRGLAMLLELLQRGLSNVDDGQPVKMARLDLARQHQVGCGPRRRLHGPSQLSLLGSS